MRYMKSSFYRQAMKEKNDELAFYYLYRAAESEDKDSDAACEAIYQRFSSSVNFIKCAKQFEVVAAYSRSPHTKMKVAEILVDLADHFSDEVNISIPPDYNRAIELLYLSTKIGIEDAATKINGFQKTHKHDYDLTIKLITDCEKVIKETPIDEKKYLTMYARLKDKTCYSLYRHKIINKLEKHVAQQTIDDKKKQIEVARLHAEEAELVSSYNEAEYIMHIFSAAKWYERASELEKSYDLKYQIAFTKYDYHALAKLGHPESRFEVELEKMSDTKVDLDGILSNVITLLPSILKKRFSACKKRVISFLLKNAKDIKSLENTLIIHISSIVRLPDDDINFILSILAPKSKLKKIIEIEWAFKNFVEAISDWNDFIKQPAVYASNLYRTYYRTLEQIDMLGTFSQRTVRQTVDRMEVALFKLYNTGVMNESHFTRLDDMFAMHGVFKKGVFAMELLSRADKNGHVWAMKNRFAYYKNKNSYNEACLWAYKIALHPDVSYKQSVEMKTYISKIKMKEEKVWFFKNLNLIHVCKFYMETAEFGLKENQLQNVDEKVCANLRESKIDKVARELVSHEIKKTLIAQKYTDNEVKKMFDVKPVDRKVCEVKLLKPVIFEKPRI